jgi:CheY-like chemotaxis protein/HPt (histidine-containing phosphotransfer) domain-containing protein
MEETERNGQPFSFAILDLQAADLEDVVRFVGAGERLPLFESARWIALTSYGGKAQLTALRGAGIEACLTKPITPSRLFDCLAAFLSDSPQRRETQELLLEAPRDPIAPAERKHVLLAEDNAINRKVTLAILEKLGYRADSVDNGKACIARLSERSYDLVLMDCQMPELDGYSASQVIRDPRSGVIDHEIPIIALTAHAMRGDRERCLAAGMDDYLPKPLDVAALRDTLRKWLNSRIPAVAEVPQGSAPQDVTPPVFDAEALRRRVLNDEELFRDVIASFCDDLPDRIQQLQSALGAGDLVAVKRQAHTIKGTSANVSADALSAVAKAIELAVEAGTGDLGTLCSRLEPELERLRQAFAEFDSG